MSVTQRAVLLWFIYVCIWLFFLARFFYFSHIYPPDSEDRFFVLPKEKSSDSEHLKMFKEVLLSSEALKPKLDRCLKVCHCFILRHACCIYQCIAVRSSRSQLITPLMGQSIFTLFASLAWAFHFLIKLLKKLSEQKKGHNNFSYLWKSQPDIPNSFREIVFEKAQKFKKMYELISVFATQQFCNFQWRLFPLLLLAKS